MNLEENIGMYADSNKVPWLVSEIRRLHFEIAALREHNCYGSEPWRQRVALLLRYRAQLPQNFEIDKYKENE